MIPENQKVLMQQIADRCLRLNEYIKQLQTSFSFDELDKDSFEKTYLELLSNIAELNYENYKSVKRKLSNKNVYTIDDWILAAHEKSSYGEQIMINCLKVDASIKTVYKALQNDEDDIEGFCNDYQYILDNALETNWNNHNVGKIVSREEYKRILLANS